MLQAFHARLLVAYADLRSKDQEGQALVEYALIISLIALVAFGALKLTGTSINAIFTGIANDL
jgi:Flp pilus assembly pilin Flp